MNKSGQMFLWTIAVPICLVLATSGCATRRYARSQAHQEAGKVNQRVSQVEAKTNEKITFVNNKLDTDISQVNEKIATTDLKLGQVAGTAQQAMAQAESNKAGISQNAAAITTLATGVANAMNYQLVEKGDVLFGFNKSNLTPEAKAALDTIIQKTQAQPRAVVELLGFTDAVGSQSYNLQLSRRRAESVQRYMVLQKVPLRNIHIVGLGEEAPPAGLEADVLAANPNATKRERDRAARRVMIRVYGAGSLEGTAARSESDPAPDAATPAPDPPASPDASTPAPDPAPEAAPAPESAPAPGPKP